MKLTTSKLLSLKMRYGILNDEVYFKVDDIRQRFPNHRCPPDKIKEVFIGGVKTEGIKADDITELSEFDKNLIRLYNLKK